MNETLMHALIECLVFLELSGDDVLNPDVAVGQIENTAAVLNELPAADREEFVRYASALAQQEEDRSGPSARTSFLRSLGSNIGLVGYM